MTLFVSFVKLRHMIISRVKHTIRRSFVVIGFHLLIDCTYVFNIKGYSFYCNVRFNDVLPTVNERHTLEKEKALNRLSFPLLNCYFQ